MNRKNPLKKYFGKTLIAMFLIIMYSCSNEETVDNLIVETADVATFSGKTSNLALGQTAEQSSTGWGGNPDRAVDGNTSGVWNDGSVTHTTVESQPWWQVRLGADYEIGDIVIWNRTNCCSDRLSNFDVFVYDASGTQVFKATIVDTPSPSVTINANGVVGARVRIKLKGSDDPLSLAEVQVFAYEEEITTNTTEIGTVDFGNLEVETSWISEDTGDRDTFDAVDVDGEEWMDVFNSGIVMMKCLAGDSHRTELKEKSGDEAALTTYKKMYYKATLTSIPSHGVTIAQVHNRTSGVKRPWIRVYVDADRYIKIKETLTTPWQTSAEGGSTYTTWVGPEYTSGDEFSVEVIIDNGNASFEIVTNGETEGTTLTPDSDWDEYSNGYYLKAGVYTEGDDNEPQIKFDSFSVDY